MFRSLQGDGDRRPKHGGTTQETSFRLSLRIFRDLGEPLFVFIISSQGPSRSERKRLALAVWSLCLSGITNGDSFNRMFDWEKGNELRSLPKDREAPDASNKDTVNLHPPLGREKKRTADARSRLSSYWPAIILGFHTRSTAENKKAQRYSRCLLVIRNSVRFDSEWLTGARPQGPDIPHTRRQEDIDLQAFLSSFISCHREGLSLLSSREELWISRTVIPRRSSVIC